MCWLQLGSLLLVALDVVDQRSDFSKATSIMVLSQTYYVVVDVSADSGSGGRREQMLHSVCLIHEPVGFYDVRCQCVTPCPTYVGLHDQLERDQPAAASPTMTSTTAAPSMISVYVMSGKVIQWQRPHAILSV